MAIINKGALKIGVEIKHCKDCDRVEVVRCKDCVYANDDGTICRYGVGRGVKPEHFCSYGERKDT